MVRPPAHPKGESLTPQNALAPSHCVLDTFDGQVTVEWEPGDSVTPLGQLPFFIEFLKIGGRFETWVEDCPLYYKASNAPKKLDLLGSIFLSILSGHSRYKHLSALRNDGVNSRLLGMSKVVSEDSARRGLKRIDEIAGIDWLQTHLQNCVDPLLSQPWILDCDVTVKPLYGHQEGAEKGYNPTKRGRPSQTYHTYMMANLRLVLDVEVQPGKQTASSYSLPGLISLLKRLSTTQRPKFVRGDCDWGTDSAMTEMEAMGVHFLFKLKQSKNVKKLIYTHHGEGQWQSLHNSPWELKESTIQLDSWDKARRVIIMRRQLPKNEALLLEHKSLDPNHQQLSFLDRPEDVKAFQYSVLVTSLEDDSVSIFHHYRDRADCENVFDEIKNHWGWGGFTTRDIKSCQLIARIIALIYNWWSLFVRLANPDGGHLEAVSSRPQLLSSVGQLTESGRQKRLKISGQHSRAAFWQQALTNLSGLFTTIKNVAKQHNAAVRWKQLMLYLIDKMVPPSAMSPTILALDSG